MKRILIWLASFALVAVKVSAGDADFVGQDNTHTQNAFNSSTVLPATVKRVLALPLACEESRGDLKDGCEILNPVLQSELIKTKRFEIVTISRDDLDQLTGKLSWTGTESLPTDFFSSLQRVYGCDAVLFCQLTSYKTFQPLAVGWRLKLVEARTKKILWATDEIFDATDPATIAQAEQFQKHEQAIDKHKAFWSKTGALVDQQFNSVLDDQWRVLNSPAYFGRFAAVKSVETLPAR